VTTENEGNTANVQLVGVRASGIVIMLPKRQMTKAEALLHAAWLVALADESEDHVEFKRVLDAVTNC
jgi:tellurite resistance protein